jgi:hypothetical protein
MLYDEQGSLNTRNRRVVEVLEDEVFCSRYPSSASGSACIIMPQVERTVCADGENECWVGFAAVEGKPKAGFVEK